MNIADKKIAIIGLGYVGLPLALAFGEKVNTVGFDLDKKRIESLKGGKDYTGGATAADFEKAEKVKFTSDLKDIGGAGIFIVTVPTPIDELKKPDLSAIEKAMELVGGFLKKEDIVILESTVYPGVTEEFCVPILEQMSGLMYNKDFFCGYAPERINPGDKIHDLKKVKKVVAGSTPEITELLFDLYGLIIEVGVFKVSDIKVAEAAKVIENAQRDINIAFVNELSKIFQLMNIDTREVLEAAATKWNFSFFQPGLVGGHCIGVDPYYLSQKSKELGYEPEVILAGRRINDSMGFYVAEKFMELLVRKGVPLQNAKVLVLGITFKENLGDIRNTRSVDIVKGLQASGLSVSVFDPYADTEEVLQKYGIRMLEVMPEISAFDGMIVAVAHDMFKLLKWDNCVVYDVKGIFPKDKVSGRL